jgi:negative regulator of sigma E activity
MREMMNDTLGESLSAFLDGELPRAEYTLLLRRFRREPGLQGALDRYSAMGECLRGEQARVSRGFAARVCQAVAAEASGHHQHRSLGLLARNRGLRRAGQLAGGLAVAATVAGVAILVLQREQVPVTGQQVAEAATSAVQTILGGNPSGEETYSYTVPAPAETGPLVAGAARLTDYVFAHSEYSTMMGRRNVLASVIVEDPTPVESREDADPASTGQEAPPGDRP